MLSTGWGTRPGAIAVPSSSELDCGLPIEMLPRRSLKVSGWNDFQWFLGLAERERVMPSFAQLPVDERRTDHFARVERSMYMHGQGGV